MFLQFKITNILGSLGYKNISSTLKLASEIGIGGSTMRHVLHNSLSSPCGYEAIKSSSDPGSSTFLHAQFNMPRDLGIFLLLIEKMFMSLESLSRANIVVTGTGLRSIASRGIISLHPPIKEDICSSCFYFFLIYV